MRICSLGEYGKTSSSCWWSGRDKEMKIVFIILVVIAALVAILLTGSRETWKVRDKFFNVQHFVGWFQRKALEIICVVAVINITIHME